MKYTKAIASIIISSSSLAVFAVRDAAMTTDSSVVDTSAVIDQRSDAVSDIDRLLLVCDCDCSSIEEEVVSEAKSKPTSAESKNSSDDGRRARRKLLQQQHVFGRDGNDSIDKSILIDDTSGGRDLQNCNCHLLCVGGMPASTQDGFYGDLQTMAESASTVETPTVEKETPPQTEEVIESPKEVDTPSKVETPCETIVDVVCDEANAKNFSTMCSLVTGTDLAGVLSSTDTNFTVFAPTNEAFDAITDVLSTLTADQVIDVLMYHIIVSKEVFAADLSCGGKVEMADAQGTFTVCNNDDIFQTGAGNVFAPKIISKDIDVCNGVVHVVDNVILPDFSVSKDDDTAAVIQAGPTDISNPEVHAAPRVDTTEELSHTASSSECNTIADVACADANAEKFGALCSLLVSAKLDGSLSSTDANFTVFAPTNQAFQDLSSFIESLSEDQLKDALLYHVTTGKLFSSDLKCGGYDIEMLNGKPTFTRCGLGDKYQFGTGNTVLPKIISTDIDVCNGVIHVIDAVILPHQMTDFSPTVLPSKAPSMAPSASKIVSTTQPPVQACISIAEAACAPSNADSFGTLCSLLTDADLAGVLSGSDTNFTVFAPTNAAFQDIAAVLPSLTSSEIKDILLYHVSAGKSILSSDLLCDGKLQMLNLMNTTTICQTGQYFQTGAGNTVLPKIIAPDISACNGVIHGLDAVLLPAMMEQSTKPKTSPTSQPTEATVLTPVESPCVTTIAQAACDEANKDQFGTLCALVIQAGLDGALSSSDSKLTVFAPTNDAFDRVSTVLATLTPEQIRTVLLTHALDGEVFFSDLSCGSDVEMLSGLNTTTLCGTTDVFQVGKGNILAPKIATSDIGVCNGVIHTISNVILPDFSQVASQPSSPEPGVVVARDNIDLSREDVNESENYRTYGNYANYEGYSNYAAEYANYANYGGYSNYGGEYGNYANYGEYSNYGGENANNYGNDASPEVRVAVPIAVQQEVDETMQMLEKLFGIDIKYTVTRQEEGAISSASDESNYGGGGNYYSQYGNGNYGSSNYYSQYGGNYGNNYGAATNNEGRRQLRARPRLRRHKSNDDTSPNTHNKYRM